MSWLPTLDLSFLNRVDESVVFHPLGKEHIKSIVDIQLQSLAKRMQESGYQLSLSNEALDYIANIGYDPVYGARPLKRAIQQNVENPLAKQILAGKVDISKPIRLIVSGEKIAIAQ